MKDVTTLAREAGIDVDTAWGVADTAIERFAALVRNKTLEEAAGVCDWDSVLDYDSQATAENIAAAIRALKEKT